LTIVAASLRCIDAQRWFSPMSRLEVPARIPPHNLDAERAVLGAILLEGRETLPRVIELLRP